MTTALILVTLAAATLTLVALQVQWDTLARRRRDRLKVIVAQFPSATVCRRTRPAPRHRR